MFVVDISERCGEGPFVSACCSCCPLTFACFWDLVS